MRFLITTAPGPDSKQPSPAEPPDEKLLFEYMRFNEEMHKAGVLVTAEGVNPEGKKARIVVKNGKRTVLDGPFPETKELLGGLFLIDVDSFEEAVEWARRAPHGLGFDDVLTVLPMTGAEDLPPEMVKLINDAAPTWSKTFIKGRK